MSEICFNCGAEIVEETPPFQYCMGDSEVHSMCDACNRECGEFMFRRLLQVMKEKTDDLDEPTEE